MTSPTRRGSPPLPIPAVKGPARAPQHVAERGGGGASPWGSAAILWRVGAPQGRPQGGGSPLGPFPVQRFTFNVFLTFNTLLTRAIRTTVPSVKEFLSQFHLFPALDL